MKKAIVVLMVAVFAVPSVCAANQQDLTKPIHQFTPKSNRALKRTEDLPSLSALPPHLGC